MSHVSDMKARRICVITGTRAEWGLLRWPCELIRSTPGLSLQLIVTAAHLSRDLGFTVREVEGDGFAPDARVEMLLASDSSVAIAKSAGLGLLGIADALDRLAPDLVLVLGDRFETFAAASAAALLRIPIAHLVGGDLTEGAIDDGLRHAITKLSSVHFPSNEDSARRLRQMGEEDGRIHVVGSPGVDAIQRLTMYSRQELERDLGFRFRPWNLLLTHHPVTIHPGASADELREILAGVDAVGAKRSGELGVIATMPNADHEGGQLASILKEWADSREFVTLRRSLGQRRYLSVMAEVDLVVGNSSSGLYEAPSVKVPTLDLGDRQKGRLRASSVLHGQALRLEVERLIEQGLTLDASAAVNPYGDGHASERIAAILLALPDPPSLLRKRFVDRSIQIETESP